MKFLLILLLFLFVISTHQKETVSELNKENKKINTEKSELFLTITLTLAIVIPVLILNCADNDNSQSTIGGDVFIERSPNAPSKTVTNQINLRYGQADQDLGLTSQYQYGGTVNDILGQNRSQPYQPPVYNQPNMGNQTGDNVGFYMPPPPPNYQQGNNFYQPNQPVAPPSYRNY
ncbi:hypothetical protein M0811_09126 [Anaeramoeba ignava]|uniref:Uncharacterized protein n=1 Tax=Anaeramoeba ignava TaxID=1746090 RepID=A0A9Q0RBN9_ANAIG|nr:hypothetical protein M0811_09126 [Anaeramoeba ignava]|eukprot:Anaeramoba_ignava/a364821_45.p1 GENE.a364821_45~~a364821_45.p1  ORF type:complete len:175 (-),score=53.49 a364821_45:25-549(-)